ncbi:MAG: Mediator of RNA polymerase II transcription subunit 18 [Peltula sp. TS41687]|nr:MAG: Mediator of RNA polymerase II transcription subunit 18 [Peltula sp. TS41687]
MHELLLFAQVPSARHDQILNIIAGIAGMSPKKIIERHVIFRPNRAPSSKSGPIGASQGVQNQQIQAIQGQLKGELFYLQLVNDLSELPNRIQDDPQHQSDLEDGSLKRPVAGAKRDGDPNSWSLCFFDIPEVAGRRPVTSRMMSRIEILEGDTMGFMNGLGYRYSSEYMLYGHRVIHNNIILLLYRLLRRSERDTANLSKPAGGIEDENIFKALSDHSSWVPLDQSGSYILQASVRVQDGSVPESMSVGITELLAFKEMMKGVVDLEVGDRLAMDTRLK